MPGIVTLAAWLGIALCAWAFVWPYPPVALGAALLTAPWLILAAIGVVGGETIFARRTASISPSAPEPTPPLTAMIFDRWRYTAWAGRAARANPSPAIGLAFFPVGGLFWRAMVGGHPVDLLPLAPYAAGLAIMLGAAGWLADRSIPLARQGRTWLALLAIAYGICGAEAANQAFDQATPRVYRTTVLMRSISDGRGGPDRELKLAPWGPLGYSQSLRVNADLFNRIATGDVVCVLLHPGVLRARWFDLALCGG